MPLSVYRAIPVFIVGFSQAIKQIFLTTLCNLATHLQILGTSPTFFQHFAVTWFSIISYILPAFFFQNLAPIKTVHPLGPKEGMPLITFTKTRITV